MEVLVGGMVVKMERKLIDFHLLKVEDELDGEYRKERNQC